MIISRYEVSGCYECGLCRLLGGFHLAGVCIQGVTGGMVVRL